MGNRRWKSYKGTLRKAVLKTTRPTQMRVFLFLGVAERAQSSACFSNRCILSAHGAIYLGQEVQIIFSNLFCPLVFLFK